MKENRLLVVVSKISLAKCGGHYRMHPNKFPPNFGNKMLDTPVCCLLNVLMWPKSKVNLFVIKLKIFILNLFHPN